MNRVATGRVGVVFAAVAVLSGCNCNPPPPDCSDLAIDTVPAADATDVAQTVDIQASLKRLNGGPASVATAKLSVRADTDSSFGAERDGTISESTATFAAQMLRPGGNTLKITLGEKDSTCSVTKDVRVTVRQNVMTPPVLMGLEFPQDTDRNGTLTGTEFPAGTQLAVRVRSNTGTGAGARVALRDGAGSTVGEQDLVMDVANFMLPAPVGDSLSLMFQATASRAAQTSNQVMGSINVRRATPMCANTTQALVGPNSDADTATAGFQLGLLGTVGATVTRARFEVTPGNLMTNANVAGQMAAGVVTLPTMGDVTYATTLIASDDFGNECRSTRMVRANFQAPVLTVTSPVSADGGALSITQTPQPITVRAMGLEDGRQICVTAQQGAGMPAQVGCGNVMNGSATFDLNLTADGATTFVVRGSDSVGNQAQTQFTATVVLEGCVPAFEAQLQCPNTYLTPSNVTGIVAGVDGGVSTGQFAFTGTARTRCAGQAARLFIGTSTTAAATTMVSPSGALTFPAATVTSGTFDVRIEVDRQGGGMPHSVSCPGVVADLTGPRLTNPAASMTPPVIINTQQDLQPSIAGAQRALGYSGTVPSSGTAVACMNQMAGSSGMACPGNTGFFVMNPASGLGASPVQGFTFPEGEYEVVVVFTRGNGIASSPPVAVRVDVTAPCVSMNGFTFPQDTAPTGGDNRLNVAELGGMNPRVAIALDPACADRMGAPAPTISIRELNGGVPGATRASGPAAGASTPLTFTTAVSTVTNLTLFAEVVDWVGNRNSAAGANNPAVRALGVFPVVPSCTITSPTANARLNAQAVSGGIFAQAQTSTGGAVGMNGVEFSLTRGAGAPVPQSATPAGSGQASTTFTTQDGSYSLSARCTDLALNQTSASAVAFQVDATPPGSCAVTAPVGGSTTISNTLATTVTVSPAETNATVRVLSTLPTAGSEVGTFALTGTSATSTLSYPLGTQNLTVTITDDFQNSCTVAVNALNVTSTTCVVTVTGGVVNGRTWLNKSVQGATSVSVTSANCPNQQATLTRTSPAGTFMATTNGSGAASFAVTPVDGDVYSITVGNSATTTVEVDFVDPVVPMGAFTVAGAAPTVGDLKFVAASGNPRVAGGALATPGYYADGNPGAAGAQIALAVNGITGGTRAGAHGHVEVRVNGVVLPPANNGAEDVNMDPKSVTFGGNPVTFTHPQRTAVPLVIHVEDQAGNGLNAFSGSVQVDVVPPGDPQLSIGVPNRNGSLALSWTSVGNDGTSGVPAAYQTRWTTRRVGGATALATEAEFFSANRTLRDTDSPGTSTNRTLRVPPLNEVIVSVRAVDELENYSVTAAGTYPSPVVVNVDWNLATITGSASTAFGRTVESADLNGDGIAELIVGAPTTASSVGAVHVYNGDGGVVSQTGCGAGCQTLTPFDSATGQFGLDVSAGGSLDESVPDLIVSQSRWSASTGRVLVYFNSTNGGAIDPAQRVEFRGDSANTFFGESVRIIRSIDGDQFDELAISTPTWPANAPVTTDRNVGRIYIFRGRARTAWAPLFGTVVSLSDADWILNGPTPRIGTGNAYGQARTGLVSAGLVDGSAVFSVPLSRQTASQAQLWRGSSFLPVPLPASPPVELSSSTPTVIQGTLGTATATTGFSQSAVGGLNLYDITVGNAFPDIVYSTPINGLVSIYPDLRATGPGVTAAAPINIAGTNLFGYALAVGDINEDGALDLVVAEGGGQLPSASVWVLYQRDASAYRASPGTSPLYENPSNSSFWTSRLDGTTVALDTYLTVRDVTGDGRLDIAFSNVSTTAPEVRVYR